MVVIISLGVRYFEKLIFSEGGTEKSTAVFDSVVW
jgi:hypothetical protein